jgi:hypothetical protein
MKFWRPVLTRVAIYGGAMLFALHLLAGKFTVSEGLVCAATCAIVFAFEAALQLTRNGDPKP